MVAKTVEDFNDGLNNIDCTFFYDDFIPTIPSEHWGDLTKNMEFAVMIDADGVVTLLDEENPNNYHIGNLGLEAISPAKYDFKELGKTINVPVKMKVSITFCASRRKHDYRYASAKFDDESSSWYFTKKDYEYFDNFWYRIPLKEVIKKHKPNGKMPFDEDCAYQLQYLMGLQNWEKISKKCYVSFCEYDISVKCDMIFNSEKIKITNKVGLLDYSAK